MRAGEAFSIKPFLSWFSPYFSAYPFPLARANEYQADATAVRLTSPQEVAEALAGSSVIDSYLSERYWPGVYKETDDQPRPSFAPFRGMGRGVATELDDGSAQAWLDKAMAQETGSANTHPAPRDGLSE